MPKYTVDDRYLCFLETQLKKGNYPDQVIEAADSVRQISREGMNKLLGTPIPPLLVNVARTEQNLGMVRASLEALKPMSVWPEGRCELRMCGCLQVVERCMEHQDREIRDLGVEILANLGIDETVREYIKATPLLSILPAFLVEESGERVVSSVLVTLVNICVADDEALAQIANKDFANKLLKIAYSRKGTGLGYKALFILRHVMKISELGKEIASSTLSPKNCKS